MIIQLEPSDVLAAPAVCAQHIQSALDQGHAEEDLSVLAEQVFKGLKQMWVCLPDDAEDLNNVSTTLLTELIQYPGRKICEISYLGGDYLADLDQLETIEDWAKNNDCDSMRVVGRDGWQRVLKPKGYQKWYTVIGKDL